MSKIYKYPNSILEAAELLDKAKPEWVNKIEKLYMGMSHTCVLGQLYGAWRNGMKELFGIDIPPSSIDNPYTHDYIFGSKASNETWQEQINKRVKEKEYVIQGLGVLFNGGVGMMVRNNEEYNLVMDNGNQWSQVKISVNSGGGSRKITKSELEKLYNIKITDLFPAKFTITRK